MKIYFETLGCPKNSNDSEVAAGILESKGHRIVDDVKDADAIIVNTCGFINDAKKESIDKIFEMNEVRGENTLLVVSGCLSQRYGQELFKEIPEVDVFIGVNDYLDLPEILEKASRQERQKHFNSCDNGFLENKNRKLPDNPYSATLKIAEGCNNVCAYCIIPAIRGPYRSRKQEDILSEAEMLAKKGCKEIILIAQDVTAYGQDIYGKFALAELLKKLCTVDGIRWIRLMYCYEDRITDELIEVIASEEKVCKYVDIPIQHSSDKVLKAMNRRSTRTSIMSTLSKLREKVPGIHIRTTLITGFPGEKKEDFQELLGFVQEVKFERLGIFAYSKEEGTTAARMKEQVRQDVKERRKDIILRNQIEISLEKNREKIGQTLEVLVEGRDGSGTYYGRTEFDAPEIDNEVIFTSKNMLKPGDMVKVKITDAFDYDLTGMEI